MAQQQQVGADGVAGLKKYDVKTAGIVFMLYCLVAAGAFGIEEMIPAAGPGMTIILLCVFPLIWAYPISNLVAECGAVLPSEGGVYVWPGRLSVNSGGSRPDGGELFPPISPTAYMWRW